MCVCVFVCEWVCVWGGCLCAGYESGEGGEGGEGGGEGCNGVEGGNKSAQWFMATRRREIKVNAGREAGGAGRAHNG